MAAFSRGFNSFLHPQAFRLPSTLRASLLNTRFQAARALPPRRPFSASILCRYAVPRGPKTSSNSFTDNDPLLRTVAKTRQPVLLYKEPPRPYFLFKVWGWATVISATGLYSFYFTTDLPEGLSGFVAPTYIVVGLLFCAIGIHIFQRPVRRISTLEVVPSLVGGPAQIRLRGKKAPWSKDTVVHTHIWNATISEKVGPILAEIAEADRARHQSITEGLEHMNILSKSVELAARWIEQKWTSFFLRFKFAVLQFEIVHMEVDGVRWKLDCTGYMAEQGAAIDRILPVD